jgi:hypothetical protein
MQDAGGVIKIRIAIGIAHRRPLIKEMIPPFSQNQLGTFALCGIRGICLWRMKGFASESMDVMMKIIQNLLAPALFCF